MNDPTGILLPGTDYEVATCCVCGQVEHTPEELADCIESATAPPDERWGPG